MYHLYILAALVGLLAAVTSWVVNGKLITIFGNKKAAIFIGPAVEESFKTGVAWILGAPLIISHATFGVVEAIWEFKAYKRGKVAGIFAFGSHLIYGLVTITVAERVGVYIALLATYTVHMLWNFWVFYYLRSVPIK